MADIVYERVLSAIRATLEEQRPDLYNTNIRIEMAIDELGHPIKGRIQLVDRAQQGVVIKPSIIPVKG